MNTFGNRFRLTTFGESHGPGIGAVIDGCPPGLLLDMDFIGGLMAMRRPGRSRIATQRQESDVPQWLSGYVETAEGLRTTGTPLCAWIVNEQARPADYDALREVFRPSHADYTYQAKYGIRDPRGGGRASARETAARVLAGAVAMLALRHWMPGLEIGAYVHAIGGLSLPEDMYWDVPVALEGDAFVSATHCPEPGLARAMYAAIEAARLEGDSLGGIVACRVGGMVAGLGEPVYGKLSAMLGAAMLSINAVKGVEFGDGFGGTRLRGAGRNDAFWADAEGRVRTRSNHDGGIQGGISNGADVLFRVAFKPTATILRPQETVQMGTDGIPVGATVSGRGRHDPCVVPRAVPIVAAMTAMTLLDALLLGTRPGGGPGMG